MELNNQPTRGAKHKKIKTLCQIAKQVPRAGAEKMKKAMKTAEEKKEFRGTEVLHDTPKCEICGGRTALITGFFCYEADDEPYVSGVEEESEVSEGECWVGAYKCDKCDNIQGLWIE